jgi:UPF0716 protein FxsA
MFWLALLFVVVPLAELYLLLMLGQLIGFWPTIGITLGTAIVGGALAKREGLRVLRAWRDSLDRLEPPQVGVIDGVLVLVGGALLITPGVITDVTGLVLLLPATRKIVARRIRRVIEQKIADGSIRTMHVTSGPGRGRSASPPEWRRPQTRTPGSGVVDTTGESLETDEHPAEPAELRKRLDTK